jgi:zinc and cadmium transporter
MFLWILVSGVAMSATLIGGAFFHMIPASIAQFDAPLATFLWVTAGFLVCFALEQFLHYTIAIGPWRVAGSHSRISF